MALAISTQQESPNWRYIEFSNCKIKVQFLGNQYKGIEELTIFEDGFLIQYDIYGKRFTPQYGQTVLVDEDSIPSDERSCLSKISYLIFRSAELTEDLEIAITELISII